MQRPGYWQLDGDRAGGEEEVAEPGIFKWAHYLGSSYSNSLCYLVNPLPPDHRRFIIKATRPSDCRHQRRNISQRFSRCRLSPPLSPSFAYRTADARGRGRGRGGIDASFASFETKSISTSPRSKGFVSIRWTNSHEKPLIVDPPLQNFSSLFFFQRTFSDPDSSHRVIIGIETYSRREEKREDYARARGLIREL